MGVAARIEQNRLKAMERRRQSQQLAAVGLPKATAEKDAAVASAIATPVTPSDEKTVSAPAPEPEAMLENDESMIARPGRGLATPRSVVLGAKSIEERNAKQTLVAQVLCRWWYVLPHWPPE